MPLRRVLLTISLAGAAAVCLVLAGAVSVIQLGVFNVAATKPHNMVVGWVVTKTMRRSVQRHAADIRSPVGFSADQVAEGFRLYDQRCVTCHGAPGIGQAPLAAGLMPPPPYLIDASRQWSPSELYWMIDNGVKMTAMPAWGKKLSGPEIWSLVAYLEFMPRLTYADYCRMRRRLNPPPEASQEPAPDDPCRTAPVAPA